MRQDVEKTVSLYRKKDEIGFLPQIVYKGDLSMDHNVKSKTIKIKKKMLEYILI